MNYHIHCHLGVTLLQYFNYTYSLAIIWPWYQSLSAIWDLPPVMLVLCMLWYAEYNVHATNVPNAMAWNSNFYIIYINDCWVGPWLRVWVNSWANFFFSRLTSHAMTLMKPDWTAFSLLHKCSEYEETRCTMNPLEFQETHLKCLQYPSPPNRISEAAAKESPITSSLYMVPHQSYAIIIYPCTSGLGLRL